MSRPFKHPKSGVYWLRKAVSADLRPLVGKREEKRSLGTKDAAEAKRRHAEVLKAIDLQWTNLRAGPKLLSEREAHELAQVCYEQWLDQHRENPSSQKFWDLRVADRVFSEAPPKLGTSLIADLLTVQPGELHVHRMEQECLTTADRLIAAKGLTSNEANRQLLARAVAAAIHRASKIVEQLARGETPDRLRGSGGATVTPSRSHRLTKLDDLIRGWAQERRSDSPTAAS